MVRGITMYCKNCGKELPDESLFCGYCGANLVEEAGEPVGLLKEQAARLKETKIDISKEDFKPLLNILKDPFEETDLSLYGSLTVILITLIACWIAFGFSYGLLAAMVLAAATLCILYISQRKDFELRKGFSQMTQLLLVPSVLIALSGIFGFFALNAFVILLRLFLLAAAIMVYIYSLERYAGHMNRWAKAILLAAVLAVLTACAISSMSWAVVNSFMPY